MMHASREFAGVTFNVYCHDACVKGVCGRDLQRVLPPHQHHRHAGRAASMPPLIPTYSLGHPTLILSRPLTTMQLQCLH